MFQLPRRRARQQARSPPARPASGSLLPAPVALTGAQLAAYLDLCLIFLLLRFSLKSRHKNTLLALKPTTSGGETIKHYVLRLLCSIPGSDKSALTFFTDGSFRFLNQTSLPSFEQGMHHPIPSLLWGRQSLNIPAHSLLPPLATDYNQRQGIIIKKGH